MLKVAMIGVGKLGEPCATVMAKHYDVVGYDPEPRLPVFPMKASIAEAVKDRDLVFIAAPTPHDPMYGGETPTSHLPVKDFDYSTTVEILKEVNKYATKKQLVVLISTVLPGTVRTRLQKHITNARFIYNPYLIAMGTVAWDFANPEMVIIGTEDGSITGDAQELINFYKPMMENNPRYEVGTWDEAEAIKIFYNTFISTKLALVNMIQDVAERNGNMNVDVVTNALAKSTHRITGSSYMKAGMGDAGACHPRDNIALRFLANRLDLGYDLFDSIMKSREVQAKNMAEKCMKYGKRITIIGKAYKPAVPYLNGSYSLLVGYLLTQFGAEVNYYDINTGDNDLKSDWTDVYLIGYWESWVKEIDWNELRNKHQRAYTIVDPWRTMPDLEGHTVIHYGNTRTIQNVEPADDFDETGNHIASVRLKGGIFVKYPRKLDGGGLNFKDDLLEVIQRTGQRSYNKCFEWCAGFGVLGFEILGMGIANRLVVSDSYKEAVDNCLNTAKLNNLSNYVTGYHTDKIADIPLTEKWDLVVSNPPHVWNMDEFLKEMQSKESSPKAIQNSARLCVDENLKAHREFFENIEKHLHSNSDIYLIETSKDEKIIHLARTFGLHCRGAYPMNDKTMPNGHILHFKF
jgi:UDPglucose 6-dehydrogenase